LPTLALVTGPPGSGKTTLAHTLAAAVGCPAICRDEIKEGMVHAAPAYHPGLNHEFNVHTLAVFFNVLRQLLAAGVTLVAEAAFQDKLWRPNLQPLLHLAQLRVIQCVVDADLAQARATRRLADNPHRAAHDDRTNLTPDGTAARYSPGTFGWMTLPAPTLHVDTTTGYTPLLPDIVAFINAPHQAAGPVA